MYRVLIADDEAIIRKGLCSIIDWDSFGFEIIGEASNGTEALSFMTNQKPDLVMIDIKMPKMHGLESIKHARELGFDGKVIILSGYSDFNYAQEAIKYKVFSYLTKPVDVDILSETLTKIRTQLDEEHNSKTVQVAYKSKAKHVLLGDFLSGKLDATEAVKLNLGLNENVYQVVLYEKYSYNLDDASYDFSDLLHVTKHDYESFEIFSYENKNIILIKGNYSKDKFNKLIDKYDYEYPPEKNSPLDTLFIACGEPVTDISDIPSSYNTALSLLEHRFFCDQFQHIMMYDDVVKSDNVVIPTSVEMLRDTYITKIVNNIQAYNRNKIAEELKNMKDSLYVSGLSVKELKDFLMDLYLSVKEKISHLYNTLNINFISNSEAVNQINNSFYLYEIITFLSEQFEFMMSSIGYSSRDSIIDDIVHYIEHNYAENITLENIAPLFGYNSSYLGKIFNQRMGLTFNNYLDNIRIEHSKKLLLSNKLQVYKIAEMVGYRNVDYFHIKFKKNTGISPAEFRKKNI